MFLSSWETTACSMTLSPNHSSNLAQDLIESYFQLDKRLFRVYLDPGLFWVVELDGSVLNAREGQKKLILKFYRV